MIDEKRVRSAEDWLRNNDEIGLDADSEGLQIFRDLWQAIKEGYTLKRGDQDEGTP